MKEENKQKALEWINEGKPCIYRSGWAYRGAGAKSITKEEALKLLPSYSFGIGFYSLSFHKEQGVEVLEFNELSANDML